MLLEIDNLTFSYGNRTNPTVLDRLSLRADAGQLLCLLGANGAGKSTLFRCMLHMLTPTGGQILVEGRDICSLSASQMAAIFSYIPQYSSPVFSYTVWEIVLMGTTRSLPLFSSPGSSQISRAEKAIRRLGIPHLTDRQIGKISGGERQTVLLARALAQQARIILMDEPTASLDYGNQLRVLSLLRHLAKEGYTILMSTHQPDHALLYADRALVMENGRISCEGAPKDVLTKETLSRLYHVPVLRHDMCIAEQNYHLCLPDLNAADTFQKRRDAHGLSMDK